MALSEVLSKSNTGYEKEYMIAATLALFAASASAQDIYKVGLLTSTDLNGDARYVGMGGAMSALGANISAMSTNPPLRLNIVAMTLR